MKTQLMTMLISSFMKILTPDLLKDFIDMVLDFVEDKVKGTKSKVDDRILLPICEMIRTTFNIPDNDDIK